MILYEKGTTDFSKNGLGYLNNVLSAKVVDALNGEYSLTFEYPMNELMSNELKEERIVKCKVADGTQQCFVIKNVSKNYNKLVITCNHLFYLLLTNLAEDIYPQNLSPKPFFDWILARANYQLPFTTTSDVSVQKTARYVRKNLVDVILGEADNSMVNLFGIEIKRNNWNIAFNSRIGADRGEKLIYGKNITGINVSIDTNEVYTRIMPVGFDGLLLPEKYVDASNINDYPYPKIAIFEFSEIKYDPDDESAYHDIDDAYAALRAEVDKLYANKINYPKVNIKVDWLELSKTEEYKQYSSLERVYLGDTIHAVIFGLNYETKVIKTTYNPLTDTIEKFEIGTFQPTITSTVNANTFEMQQINPGSILEQAKTNATNLITTAMGGYVYKTNEELYIMDNSDPAQAQKVWRWNINGLGYSSTGINGTYGLAMTMDGAIVADFITTGVLRTSVIEGYDSLTQQVSDNTDHISIVTQTAEELNSKIQDIADITVAEESEYASVSLLNVNESQPILIKIHPTTTNISYLYPRASGLYPSDTLYLPDRRIKFTNTSTNEVFYYELFDDLLYYDENNYDEFYFDYDNNLVQITKKCEYNANGEVVLKSSTLIETTTFPSPDDFYLTTGNYTITIPGYSRAYLMVRCMASNIYTSQFATHSEISQTANQIRTEVEGIYATQSELAVIDSRITQTATEITSEVSETYSTKTQTATAKSEAIASANESTDNKLTNYSTTLQMNSAITQKANEITSSVSTTYATQNDLNTTNSRISQTAKSIGLTVNNNETTSGIIITLTKTDGSTSTVSGTIQMNGLVSFSNLSTSGQTQINGGNITTGTISTNRLSSNVITTSNFSAQNINASKITSGTLTSRAINNGNGTFSVSAGGNITAKSGTIGGWSLNSLGLSSSNVGLYPNYFSYDWDGEGHYVSVPWKGLGLAGTAYSDKRLKKNIKSLNDKYNDFFDELKPVLFKWKKTKYKTDDKEHIGFIAQDIKEAEKNNNLDLGIVYRDKDLLNLDKRELIALNTWQIQLLKKQVQEQQKQIDELKELLKERIDK